MRYRLRTLLILLAVLPPVCWLAWATYWQSREWEQRRLEREIEQRIKSDPDIQKLLADKAAEEADAKAWSNRIDAYHRKRRGTEAGPSQPATLNRP